MSERDVTNWKLLVAIGIAIASAVALSSAATVYWMDEPDEPEDPPEVTETDDEREESSEESADEETRPGELHDPKDDSEDRHVYELPDHSGRLIGKRGAQKIGLPKVEADYDVHVRGDLATVVVEQSFENPTGATIEPTYQFPLYEKAAVYGMTMRVGDRVIESEVQRKEQARETYEKAKRQGKKAALLEQDRPNLFTQKVANVEPDQKVEITLRYTHPVPKRRGTYRLTVPLSVSGAYTPLDMSDNRLVDDDPDDPGNKSGGGDKTDRLGRRGRQLQPPRPRRDPLRDDAPDRAGTRRRPDRPALPARLPAGRRRDARRRQLVLERRRRAGLPRPVDRTAGRGGRRACARPGARLRDRPLGVDGPGRVGPSGARPEVRDSSAGASPAR
jgi:hypothetical protein